MTGEAHTSAAEAVYNRIAMLRAERKVSRRELADALGVHYQTVGYLERGEYSPSLYLALRIAAYFEVPVEVIFSTSEQFPRPGVGGRGGRERGLSAPPLRRLAETAPSWRFSSPPSAAGGRGAKSRSLSSSSPATVVAPARDVGVLTGSAPAAAARLSSGSGGTGSR